MPVWPALVTVYVLWGTTYLAMRFAVDALPPWTMAGWRFVVAGALSLLLARVRGNPLPPAREWVRAIPGGVLFFVIGNGMVAIAEQSIDSGVAAVVAASTPLFAAAMNALRGERPQRGEVIGMILGMTGVLILAGSSAILDAGLRGLLLLLAPVGFAGGSVLVRAGRSGPTRSASAVIGPQMVTGGAAMLFLGVVTGEHLPAHPPWTAVAAWAYLVVFGSVVGFTAYAWLLRNARPATAMSYAYVNPLVAVVLGAALAGEHLSWTTAIAATLIAAGVMCAVTLRGTSGVAPASTPVAVK